MISDPSGLAELIDRIRPSPAIALDTEADSLHSYFEKICLVQVGTHEGQWLVDPLAGLDLKPLFHELRAKRVVLHGADYDLRLLHRSHKFACPDLLDTMIAARLCGLKELGLAALVEKFFGAKLSKASQRANWAVRPLPPQMADYALNDIRYLLDLGRILEDRLREMNRWQWFEESRDRMAAAAREVRPRDDAKAWRIAGSAKLSPRAQSVLRILWQWRDAEARAWDRPAFHVLSNEDLLRMARDAAAGGDVVVSRMTQKRRRSFDVVLALALQVPETEWPRPERPERRRVSRDTTARLGALRTTRDKMAEQLGLDPSILAPRQALEATAEDPDGDALMTWQRELLGLGNGR